LERTKEEEWVNEYNPILLIIWEGNHDIKYIHDIFGILDDYVTPYLTKAEFTNKLKLWENLNKAKSLRSRLKSLALQTFKNRLVGSMEASLRCLGYDYYETSQKVKWLNSYEKQKRNRRIKNENELKKLNLESKELFLNNIIDCYYPNRPDLYINTCLYDFASCFEKVPNMCKNNDSHADCIVLKNNLGFMHKKNKPFFLSTPIYSSNLHYREKYFHQLIILFKYWTNENQLKIENKTYEQSFRFYVENKIIEPKNTIFLDQQKRIENSIKILDEKSFISKIKFVKTNKTNHSNGEKFNFLKEIAITSKINLNSKLNEINNEISQLNNEQLYFFNDITLKIEQQIKNKNEKKIRTFCSGVGGIKKKS
jgi:hypothetical protein